MPKVKVGLNGIGRIGRTLVREWLKRNSQEFEIVALNNPGRPETYVHLLRYDSVHGKLPTPIQLEDNKIFLGSQRIHFFNKTEPKDIPWSDVGVDIVIDATGKFKDRNTLGQHLEGSVKKVIMCAPGKDLDATFVVGINQQNYNPAIHHIVSNASCTTNCLAPLAKVLHENWGIENGFMLTVHSYTADQNLLDGTHKDLRRARAAAMSMIPTTTGAAKSLGLVIPELEGKLDGYAVRVPTPNVSLVDLNVNLRKKASKEEINLAFKKASEGELKGILAYSKEELVSTDFVGSRESSVFDAGLTNVIDLNVKVVAWYDNEVGFSNRVLDLTKYIGDRF